LNPTLLNPDFRQISSLLRGETKTIQPWLNRTNIGQIILFFTVIIFGSASYGAAIGLWRDPLQAFYTAVKFPLLIILTTVGNALLNGMLAHLLGLNIGFRQCFLAIVMSFTIDAAILGAFSPLAIFLVWNIASIAESATAFSSHSIVLLTHVTVIAFAGIVANLRLLQLLQHLSGNKTIGWKILLGWLAGNLFLGSQLSWILRPFVGSPGLPVQFFRDDALSGNFYEAVFNAIRHLFS
jgi:hypothetical protein